MEINRNKIDKIIDEFDKIAQKNSNEEFDLAMYMYIRYGFFQYYNYISNDELEEINKIIKKYDSIFNEDINMNVEFIVGDF